MVKAVQKKLVYINQLHLDIRFAIRLSSPELLSRVFHPILKGFFL